MTVVISSSGLSPSSAMVQGKGTIFPNYAGRDDVDDLLKKELSDAGIDVHEHEFLRDRGREVKTSIEGCLCNMWIFDRAWYYWVAKGPGIPPKYSNSLYETHGEVVRVNGHCGCLSPTDQFKGFAVGCYHVDTAEGLKALADTIKQVVEDAKARE